MKNRKRCPVCWIVKGAFEFSKDKKTEDGLKWCCKECMYEYKKKYRKDSKHWRRQWARSTLYNHKKRGFKIDMNVDELTEVADKADKCWFCGIKLSWGPKGKPGAIPSSPTLDRIDNQRLINKDTIVILCHECNMAKGTKTLREFYEYCKMITPILKELLRNRAISKV